MAQERLAVLWKYFFIWNYDEKHSIEENLYQVWSQAESEITTVIPAPKTTSLLDHMH